MQRVRAGRPVVSARTLGWALVPVALPAALMVAAVGFIGGDRPGDIAPGSGLKFVGLGATALTAWVAWRLAVRGSDDRRVRKLAGLLCVMVGLIGWPLWTLGVMPAVNAAVLRDERLVEMTFERTEATKISRSLEMNHWAWLRPKVEGAGIAAGRYLVPETTYDEWSAAPPDTVELRVATGLLGATTVLELRRP